MSRYSFTKNYEEKTMEQGGYTNYHETDAFMESSYCEYHKLNTTWIQKDKFPLYKETNGVEYYYRQNRR